LLGAHSKKMPGLIFRCRSFEVLASFDGKKEGPCSGTGQDWDSERKRRRAMGEGFLGGFKKQAGPLSRKQNPWLESCFPRL